METVALVSCSKKKHRTPLPARYLYASPLFRGMRHFAEDRTKVWFVLSAKHGLLNPNLVIEPYDKTLASMSRGERLAWARDVEQQFVAIYPRPHEVQILVLAGETYRKHLVPMLAQRGYAIEIPFAGMQIGEQLHRLSGRPA